MPSRTYVGIDFINYIAGFTSNGGSNTASAVQTNQMDFTISSSGVNTVDPAGFNDTAAYLYTVTADLDFDVFPAIPENALVTEVEVRIDISVSATAGASSSNAIAPNPCTTGGVFRGKVYYDDGVNPPVELTDLSFEEIDEDMSVGPGSISSSVSDFDHYTSVQIFDFTGSPITKAALVAQFTSWIVELEGIWGAGADTASDPGSTGSTSENSGFSFDGIQIQVTYQSGPEISMSPSGGNVEVGQQVTINGNINNVAAVINDLVIKIPFKEVGPNEFVFEIPYPPTDDCTGCIATCPECETCADACAEDLESEACQECMQSCLDCLTTCLENLELAEACQESAPEGTITIFVTGTQFSGSVALGNFVILEAEGSGIYRFVANKRNDTLYSTARDGSTYDVKIPNPGGKTGFFRS